MHANFIDQSDVRKDVEQQLQNETSTFQLHPTSLIQLPFPRCFGSGDLGGRLDKPQMRMNEVQLFVEVSLLGPMQHEVLSWILSNDLMTSLIIKR